MQLALVGGGADALELAGAIAESGGAYELVWIALADDSLAQLSTLAPRAKLLADWESLLAPGRCDGVILAEVGDQQLRDDQLRRLTQAAIPVLVIHPAGEAIVGFEIDMIRSDTRGLIQPYFAGCRHPALGELSEMTGDDGTVGVVEQAVFERRLANRSRKAVLSAFARDVELLRRVLGPITKINALAPGEGDQAFVNLSVQMSGAGTAVARWSAAPAAGDPQGELTLIGSNGQLRLTMPLDERRWRIGDQSDSRDRYAEWNGPRAALDAFAEAIKAKAADDRSEPTFDWSDACRACELAEAVERSVSRGRTIELHLEQHSEEETFKGMMAAGGCLLVIFALVALFVGSLIGGFQLPSVSERAAEKIADAEPPATSMWLRIWPVYPFAIFLALQLLRLVFRKPEA